MKTVHELIIDELAADQGWTDETVGNLARQFILENKHGPAFIKFLRETAKEENS